MAVFSISSIDVAAIPADKIFAVDTNVLYFLYSGYLFQNTSPEYQKYVSYSNFIGRLLQNGNMLCISTANMQELCHLIERKEYQKYCSVNSLQSFSLKDYRAIPAERARIKSILQSIYQQINNTYLIYDLSIEGAVLQRFLAGYDQHRYDPIDYIVAERCLAEGVRSMVTDDRDFQADTRLDTYVV